MPHQPMVGATGCFGTTANTNGNGINHDASLCLNMADDAALDAVRFYP